MQRLRILQAKIMEHKKVLSVNITLKAYNPKEYLTVVNAMVKVTLDNMRAIN